MLLRNEWVINEIKEEIKRYLDTKKYIYNDPKCMGHGQSSSKREIHSNTDLLQRTRKSSNKLLNLISKGTRKRKTKPKVSKRKEIIKITAEINKIESKEKIN